MIKGVDCASYQVASNFPIPSFGLLFESGAEFFQYFSFANQQRKWMLSIVIREEWRELLEESLLFLVPVCLPSRLLNAPDFSRMSLL